MSTGEVRSGDMDDDVERKRCLCRLGSVDRLWVVDVGGAKIEADAAGGSSSKSAAPEDAAVDEEILG